MYLDLVRGISIKRVTSLVGLTNTGTHKSLHMDSLSSIIISGHISKKFKVWLPDFGKKSRNLPTSVRYVSEFCDITLSRVARPKIQQEIIIFSEFFTFLQKPPF